MPLIKYKKMLEKTFNMPVFKVEDLVNQGIPHDYVKKVLYQYARSGKIFRIERGKYTSLDDPIAVASLLTAPCYISMWSAMSIRGLTDQIPFTVEVVTSRKRFNRKIDFKGTQIIFYTVRPAMMFGYENIIWKERLRIPIAKPEKIVIDALYFGTIPVGELEEAVAIVDKRLLSSYVKLMSNKRISSAVKRLITC